MIPFSWSMATSLLAVGLVVTVASWGVSLVVQRVGRHRFDDDVRNAALVGVATARTALVTPWKTGDYPALRRALEGLAREQHVVAVAACRTDFSELASTRDYPDTFACNALSPTFSSRGLRDDGWTEELALGDEPFQVSAVPLQDEHVVLGAVVFVRDLAVIERRERIATRCSFVAFGLLSIIVAISAFLVGRRARDAASPS